MVVDEGEAVTPVGMCSFKTLLLDVSGIGNDKNSRHLLGKNCYNIIKNYLRWLISAIFELI